MSASEIAVGRQVQPRNQGEPGAGLVALPELQIPELESSPGSYQPRCFDSHQYQTLSVLCQAILPADHECGGAAEAGVPEWIATLADEGQADKTRLIGGLIWMDVTSASLYSCCFKDCSPAQQKDLLDLLAGDPSEAGNLQSTRTISGLACGRRFFNYIRSLAADGFFTSKIGMNYLGYLGNVWQPDFAGCPELAAEETADRTAAEIETEKP